MRAPTWYHQHHENQLNAYNGRAMRAPTVINPTLRCAHPTIAPRIIHSSIFIIFIVEKALRPTFLITQKRSAEKLISADQNI